MSVELEGTSSAFHADLGFDETIRLSLVSEEDRAPTYEIDVVDETGSIRTFVTISVLTDYGANAVFGRATPVWKVFEKGNPLVLFALKDCWVQPDRRFEHVSLAGIRTQLKDDPRLKHFLTVATAGGKDFARIRIQMFTSGATTASSLKRLERLWSPLSFGAMHDAGYLHRDGSAGTPAFLPIEVAAQYYNDLDMQKAASFRRVGVHLLFRQNGFMISSSFVWTNPLALEDQIAELPGACKSLGGSLADTLVDILQIKRDAYREAGVKLVNPAELKLPVQNALMSLLHMIKDLQALPDVIDGPELVEDISTKETTENTLL
ncbi:hypothetical protein BDP27DRAFT_1541851 [Rhodocollybia butyracea]|uniref:Fungal-type protein kinase domain-containing protein n=1 Tax=Rhodocollybia butyracea TaxID=206335 RepID=A0A9P5P4U9_9AGAR|nr:hypothetical protein BDP27DRAFT_1541851 [Rhodocollybia butyracea]